MSGRPSTIAIACFRRILYGQSRDPHSGWVQLSIEKIIVHTGDLIHQTRPTPRRMDFTSYLKYKDAVIEHGVNERHAERDRERAKEFFWGDGDSGVELFCDCAGLSTQWVREIVRRLERKFATHALSVVA